MQPPLAAHGCQCHLKEASTGRIGMTSWKRSFLATRALNPLHLAKINSQARVSWSYNMQVILRYTVDQNSQLSSHGLHCSKIGGKQGNIMYVIFCWKISCFLFRNMLIHTFIPGWFQFRHIVVFLPVSVVTAGPNYSWQGKFLANSSSGYFRKNRKVSVFNWTV